MFMQPGNFYSRLAEVIDDNFSTGGSGSYVVAKFTMRPLDIMNV
jgi:hypothetical protein